MVFKHAVENAGARGLGLFVDDAAEPTFFVMQYRFWDLGVPHPPDLDPRLIMVSDTGIKYCPWCGKELLKWYRRELARLSRADLAIPFS